MARYYAPDVARGIAVKSGSIYVTGQTFSDDFPVVYAGPAQVTSAHYTDWDAFAMKLDAEGNLGFSRYLGYDSGLNRAKDVGRDIAVDDAGYSYICGTMGVVKLSPDGRRVGSYASGLFDAEGGYGIALDAAGNIYLTGSEAVGVIKLYPDGSLAYQTTGLGGPGYDIAVGPSGNAYVAGTMGMVRLNASGTRAFTTPLDGTGYAIAYRDGFLYVAGLTSSASFPTTRGAFDTTYNQSGDAFIAKLTTGGALVYASYLGGGLFDVARGVTVDKVGNIYVTGTTFSGNFPTSPNAMDATLAGFGDAFLAVIAPNGAGAGDLLYSTYIGGNDPAVSPYLLPDRMFSVALDEQGFIYLAGEAGSLDFPVTQASPVQGFTDLVVMKLRSVVPTTPTSQNYLPLLRRQ